MKLLPTLLQKVRGERVVFDRLTRVRILKRDRFMCRYCGKVGGEFHLDHIWPVYWGGPDADWNLATACPRCNQRKGRSLLRYWPRPWWYWLVTRPWRLIKYWTNNGRMT